MTIPNKQTPFVHLELSLKVISGYLGTYPQLMLFASIRSNRQHSAALTVECTSDLADEGAAEYSTKERPVSLSELDVLVADLVAIGSRAKSEPLDGEPDCSWWAQAILEATINDQTLRFVSYGHGLRGQDAADVNAVFNRITLLLDIQSEFVRRVLTA